MVKDVLLSHPTHERLHIVPTVRDVVDGLALSSRNVYLTPEERKHAPALFGALSIARDVFNESFGGDGGRGKREDVLRHARDYLEQAGKKAAEEGVEIKLDYLELCDAEDFSTDIDERGDRAQRTYIVSGAIWVGKTRLIDNLLLGDVGALLY